MTPDPPFIIRLDGAFDVRDGNRMGRLLSPSLFHRNVVVDFRQVTWIDTTALTALTNVRRRRAALGFPPKHFAGMPPAVRRVFDVANLDRIWQFFDSVDAAAAAFAPKR